MEMQYFKEYSPELGRDMECKLYGHAGRPMLYIPCQDGRFFDFENFQFYHQPDDEFELMDTKHMTIVISKIIPVLEQMINAPKKEIKLNEK